jgi:hypothetical protein
VTVKYIVRSGPGFLLEIVAGTTPHLTTDLVEATRLSAAECSVLIDEIERLGFVAEPVMLRIGHYS